MRRYYVDVSLWLLCHLLGRSYPGLLGTDGAANWESGEDSNSVLVGKFFFYLTLFLITRVVWVSLRNLKNTEEKKKKKEHHS